MNSYDSIGGYFELELRSGLCLHSQAIMLNSGRNCFEYVLRANGVEHVYMPKFTCDAMLEPLKKLNIPYTFYSINEKLEIVDVINTDNSYIVYVNYYGIKDEYSNELSDIYGDRLILDCSQAFYFEPLTVGHTFYSPRKFFGLPDGGMLFTNNILDHALDQDFSFDRMTHLLKRIDLGAESAYADFKHNDSSLVGEPIKKMSRLTGRLLENIDYEDIRNKRIENFLYLHNHLKNEDKTSVELSKVACPMYYPLLTGSHKLRQRLIDKKVFTPTYWPNVFEWCGKEELEFKLAENTILLPIDQRYGLSHMGKILDILYEG